MKLRINISNRKDTNKGTRTLFLWLLLLITLTLIFIYLSFRFPNSIFQYIVLIPFLVFIIVPKKNSFSTDDEEQIELYKNKFVSLKYGVIEIEELRSIKTQRFIYIETLILKMETGEKYYVSQNYKWKNSNNDDYYKLRDYLLKIAKNKNSEKNRQKRIEIRNSSLEFIPFIMLGGLILFLIWLFVLK